MGCRVQGLGSRVKGLGFRVWRLVTPYTLNPTLEPEKGGAEATHDEGGVRCLRNPYPDADVPSFPLSPSCSVPYTTNNSLSLAHISLSHALHPRA
jgi:hypothetical protein